MNEAELKSALRYFMDTYVGDEDVKQTAAAWLDTDPVPVKPILAKITPHMRRMNEADVGLWLSIMYYYM
ncbi:hypothetical protein CR152_19565 [Massilia violaceinigra]|uniref:Uncharacterized protein n=1 Tax=Massilia violaceinigra TaxID=2045208 RepID=A0A2D2DND0_9BURK|nr:hypothetical protein [Massilia violaceinigra]ATQ76473.1 hypothetical protein CR152_19565 [Massilia violaceinigra]